MKKKFPPLQFKFQEFIDIYEFLVGAAYSLEEKTAYFYCIGTAPEETKQEFIDGIEQSITHETIHYVIQKLTDDRYSYGFDDVWKKVKEWDEEVYNMLY